MAEIELSILARQCLGQRFVDRDGLRRPVAAGQARRPAQRGAVDWRFTTGDARVKLRRLYPSIRD